MKLLSDLPRNAKVPIMVEPMWAIFGGMILFYAPLYMNSMGLSKIEMGLINTINLFMAFLFHFSAGPITNRLGRKKTTLIFDLVSWTIPMFIWAIAQNFWYFLAAYMINAAVKVVSVSWYCLITEDTPPDKRSRVFGIINILNYATGVFTPITGLLILKFGTISTLRWLYAIGLVSMTTMFLVRNALTTETKAGLEIMQHHSGLTIRQSLKLYLVNIYNIRKDRQLILITCIFIITSFIVSMNFFQVLYLKDYLKFSEGTISLIPFVGAGINLALYIFILPKFRNIMEERALAAALLIASAGSLLFLFIPSGSILLLVISVAVLAVGNFIMQTYRDSVFMNNVGEHEKADMYAAVQTVTTLISIPSGYLGGLAFHTSPKLPFIIILALFLLAFAVAARIAGLKNKSKAIGGIQNEKEGIDTRGEI